MTWNHRVLKTKDGVDGSDWYAIHEVFYEDGKPRSYTANPIDVSGESIDDIRWVLERMRECLDKPALTPADFGDGTP
jgi:hypothetical protein